MLARAPCNRLTNTIACPRHLAVLSEQFKGRPTGKSMLAASSAGKDDDAPCSVRQHRCPAVDRPLVAELLAQRATDFHSRGYRLVGQLWFAI
jgi:hypothetical protein